MKNKGLVRGTIQIQIDDEHWVSYYYSNCDSEPYASYTFYKGDLCVPEYSEEILHTSNDFKILDSNEILIEARRMLYALNRFVKLGGEDNEKI